MESLGKRINDLPLVLCGPILRHTEPSSVTVWVALKEARSVTLRIYARSEPGSLTALTEKAIGTRQTVRLGAFLHVIGVTAIPTTGELVPGELYFYDLFFAEGSVEPVPETANNLLAAGIVDPLQGTTLEDLEPTNLSYSQEHRLPSFSLSPANLNKLRLVHGSCRQPHAEGLDALPALDDILATDWPVPDERPHQLFLTGDQVYANSPAPALLLMLTDAGNVLVGGLNGAGEPNWEESLPPNNKKPSDLKPGARNDVVTKDGGLPSNGGSHCLAFGEFSAMHLFVWSPLLWPKELPDFEDVYPDKPRRISFPLTPLGPVEVDSEDFQAYRDDDKRLRAFRTSLRQVRRALANIPTYMIFDDHEVTDNWYLVKEWCQEVLSKPLGRRIIQNGLLAYAVFQAWGNTPDQFEANQPGQALLEAASTWVQKQEEKSPLQAIREQEEKIARRVGLPKINELFTTDDGSEDSIIAHPEGSLNWHYSITGPSHEVIVLDTRTWRGYPIGDRDPAALLSRTGFRKQRSVGPALPKPITMVIASTNVITAPFTRGFVSDLWYLLKYIWYLITLTLTPHPVYDLGLGDSWEGQSRAFETLLAWLASRAPETGNHRQARVLILSGDVHYSFTCRLQYWAKSPLTEESNPSPVSSEAIFAQLTSSPLRKEDGKKRFLHGTGYELNLFSNSLPEPEKWMGWRKPLGEVQGLLVPTPGGQVDEDDVRFFWDKWQPFQLRASPAMLLANDLPDFPMEAPRPDWRYRIDYLLAEDEVREPAPFAPLEVHAPPPGNRTEALRSYLAMARNHKDYADKWGHGKEIVGVNNLAEISFQWEAETTLAVDITANQVSFPVTDSSTFPDAPFHVIVDDEVMEVKDPKSLANTFSNVQRGRGDTRPASHNQGATVRLRKALLHEHWWRLESKGDDEILLKPFPLSEFRVSLEFDDQEYPMPTLPGEA